MPIYAFECPNCGHAFDRLQKLSDPDPTQCPVCASEGIRRQLTAPSFRLSGSGWYETDFKKDGEKKRNLVESGSGSADSKPESKPEAAAAPKADSKADAKVDAKPAAKVETKPSAPPSSAA